MIQGEIQVKPLSYRGISSAIRAFGHDAVGMTEALGRVFTPSECWVRMTVSTRSNRNDFSDYVEGVQALRSAVAKAPAWSQVWPNIPFGRLLDLLTKGEPQLKRSWRQESPWSSKGDTIFVLSHRKVSLPLWRRGLERAGLVEKSPDSVLSVGPQYGMLLPLAEMESILFPPE